MTDIPVVRFTRSSLGGHRRFERPRWPPPAKEQYYQDPDASKNVALAVLTFKGIASESLGGKTIERLGAGLRSAFGAPAAGDNPPRYRRPFLKDLFALPQGLWEENYNSKKEIKKENQYGHSFRQ